MAASVAGPTWVGIGAMRSGTTWLTDLLLQHPALCLGSNGRKEQHFFRRYVTSGWSETAAERYRDLFRHAAAPHPGEFTPAYLRAPWVAPLLKDACRADPPLLVVILRDPIDRFVSHLRWAEGRPARQEASGRVVERHTARTRVADADQAAWAGCYATQLAAWTAVFGRERFAVIQYETLVAETESIVADIWARLGLDPLALHGVSEPSRTATGEASSHSIEGLLESLRVLYEPQVAALEAEWGIDRSRWPNFR